ncbi:hypothetical protein Pcinc_008079 [Petrolisthes cinctipes]|uniref:Uncharacterized protein n=1 Tax=Petrolisthes cinctipes TaxID=88211 RepID=A0AAE1KXL5_PETCI|nr:hypothetical protein Pcinc_008079 [Petrolisthes cinctipes]
MSFSSNDKEKDWMVVMLGLIHTPNRTKGDILVGRCNATTTNTNTTDNTNHNTHTNNNHINTNTHTNSSHTNTNTHTNSSHTNTNTHTNSTHTNTNTHTNSSHTNTNTHTNSSHTHTASTTTTTRSNKETDTTEKMTRTLTSSHNTPRGIVIMVNQTHIQVNEKTVGQHVMLQTASHSFNTFPSLTLRVSCSVGTPYCGFISTCKSKDPDVFKPTLPSPNLFLASLTTKMVLVMVLVCVVCGTVLAWRGGPGQSVLCVCVNGWEAGVGVGPLDSVHLWPRGLVGVCLSGSGGSLWYASVRCGGRKGLYFCQGPGIEASQQPTQQQTLLGETPDTTAVTTASLPPRSSPLPMSSYTATLRLGIGGPESTVIVTLVMYCDGAVGYCCLSTTV